MQQEPYTTFAAQLRLAAGKGTDAIESAAGLPSLTTIGRAEFPQWPANLLLLRGNTAPAAIHELAANRAKVLGGMGVATAPTDRPDVSA